jgi:hypothetical protein
VKEEEYKIPAHGLNIGSKIKFNYKKGSPIYETTNM